jgi:hypothetical protein
MKARIAYQGIVRDRLDNYKVVYRSRPSLSWDEVQTKAERRARSLGCGDRFDVAVENKEIGGAK